MAELQLTEDQRKRAREVVDAFVHRCKQNHGPDPLLVNCVRELLHDVALLTVCMQDMHARINALDSRTAGLQSYGAPG